jgi:hypothetical protein
MAPTIHPRDFALAGVEPKIHIHLRDVQKEHGLTDCEMIEILLHFVQKDISYFIKHEHEEQDAEQGTHERS